MIHYLRFLCVAACVFSMSAAHSQAVFAEGGTPTGKALEKPMVMKPFVEFSKTHQIPATRIFTLEGEKVNFEDYQGKLLILNVWGTWCTPCVREIPQLIELQKKLKDSNIALVGVALDKSVEAIPKFLKKHKMSEFKTWSDPTESVSSIMPMEVVPTNFVIDGSGNLVGYLPGYLPWDDKDVLPFLRKLADKYAQPNLGTRSSAP